MKFSVSPLFVVMGVVMALMGKITLLSSYVIAVVLHELAHAEIATRRGFRLNKLKLTPFGASVSGNLNATTPKDETVIALAGPIVSAVIYFFTVASWWIAPETYYYTQNFAEANLSLALFNLLPVYPLDGGRILYATIRKSTKKPYKTVKVTSIVIAFALLFTAVVCARLRVINLVSLITVGFVAVTALLPEKRCVYSALYDLSYRTEKCKNGLPLKIVAITRATSVGKMKRRLSGDAFTVFCVIDHEYAIIPETLLDTAGDSEEATALCLIKVKK